MRTSSHFPTDLLTFTEEILNVKIQFCFGVKIILLDHGLLKT